MFTDIVIVAILTALIPYMYAAAAQLHLWVPDAGFSRLPDRPCADDKVDDRERPGRRGATLFTPISAVMVIDCVRNRPPIGKSPPESLHDALDAADRARASLRGVSQSRVVAARTFLAGRNGVLRVGSGSGGRE